MPRKALARPTAPLDKLVGDLYGALADDLRLEDCLDVLSPAFGSHITGLRTEEVGARRAYFALRGALTPQDASSLSSEYSQRWSGQNLWMERSIEGYLRQGYQYGEAAVSDSELLASPFYQEYLKRVDIRHGMGICLWTDRVDNFVVASFNRRPRMGPVGANEIALAQQLRPHLINLYAIYRRIARLEDAAVSLKRNLDRIPIGVLVIDVSGKILQCNAKADYWLSSESGVARHADGKLFIRHRPQHALLRQMLARLTNTDWVTQPQTLFIPRSHHREVHGLVLHLCAFPQVAENTLTAGGRILAFLYDASAAQGDEIASQMLQGAMNLTAAEARVALLLRTHKDPGQVASALGVAISTVRTHIKHLFQKTGTQRQSELLLLIDRLVWMAPR